MNNSQLNLDRPRGGSVKTIGDIALICVLTACLIAICVHAPSQTYMHAQLQQIGAVIGTIENDWLLPRDQGDALARKPQLYAWLAAPVLAMTGIYNDFTFRLPTVAAMLAVGLMIYLLGRRWWGRRAGLIAACLWIAPLHMSKAAYLAVTDMMLTLWMLLSIYCADRLLFHPPANGKRGLWAVGLWAAMILGAMTKGWGVLNLILVGGTLALATGLGPGFAEVGGAVGIGRKLLKACGLVLRRWREAMRATYFVWGVVAMAAVLAPVCVGMFARGGEEFRQIIYYEFWSRITGQGENVPHSSSVPAVVHLVYYLFPTSVFAIAAMALTPVRRWFAANSPTAIPLCWIIGVVAPFSLTHGFRHDYLLPCYPAGALMGAWAVLELSRLGRAGADKKASAWRHVLGGVGVGVTLAVILLSAAYLFHEFLPESLAKNIPVPPIVATATWPILAGLIVVGAVALVVAVWASLRWRLGVLTGAIVVGMLGVAFLYGHMLSRPAKTGDGERMVRFARHVRPMIGDEAFATCRARKLATELYLGRFGLNLIGPQSPKILAEKFGDPAEPEFSDDRPGRARKRAWVAFELLDRASPPWLITCDKALVELGLAEQRPYGEIKLKRGKQKLRFKSLPQLLGEVRIISEPIRTQRWGRAYLIRLDHDKLAELVRDDAYLRASALGFESGRQE